MGVRQKTVLLAAITLINLNNQERVTCHTFFSNYYLPELASIGERDHHHLNRRWEGSTPHHHQLPFLPAFGTITDTNGDPEISSGAEGFGLYSTAAQRSGRFKRKTRDELLHEVIANNAHPIVSTEHLRLEDFLWTGERGDESEDDDDGKEEEENLIPQTQEEAEKDSENEDGENAIDEVTEISPTRPLPTFTATFTITSTIVVQRPVPTQESPDTPYTLPGEGNLQPTGATPPLPEKVDGEIQAGQPLPPTQHHHHHQGGDHQDGQIPLPEEKFLVRTVILSNMTILHNRIEGFKSDMEKKLTEAYLEAFSSKRIKRNLAAEDLRLEEQLEIDVEDPETERTSRNLRTPRENDQIEKPELKGEETEIESQTERPKLSKLPRVRIHNIRSSLPEPEIEMIYTVEKGEELLPATQAVSVLKEVDESQVSRIMGFPIITQAEPYLVHAEKLVNKSSSQMNWLIAAVIVSSLLALAVLTALLFLVHRYKNERSLKNLNKHKRLESPTGSGSVPGSPADHSHLARSGGMIKIGRPDDKLLDQSTFTMLINKGKVVDAASGPSPASSALFADLNLALQRDDARNEAALLEEGTTPTSLSDAEHGRGHRGKAKRGFRAKNDGSSPGSVRDTADGEEDEDYDGLFLTPSGGTSKNKNRKKSKRKSGNNIRNVGVSTNKFDAVEQSSFPSRTPEQQGIIGPLSDLLEEEIALPGESRQSSASTIGRTRPKDWPFLQGGRKSPTASTTTSTSEEIELKTRKRSIFSSDASNKQKAARDQQTRKSSFGGSRNKVGLVHEEIKVVEDEDVVGEEIIETDPAKLAVEAAEDKKKRSISAKSHIFRKAKVDVDKQVQQQDSESEVTKSTVNRPWSASESRLQAADPVFHMRQKHWEDLIAGKKKLHRGQLLPGSTSEEDQLQSMEAQDSSEPPLRSHPCWSEVTSPRKQVRIVEPVRSSAASGSDTEPIIQAIKEELQRFHRARSPNNLSGISVINETADLGGEIQQPQIPIQPPRITGGEEAEVDIHSSGLQH